MPSCWSSSCPHPIKPIYDQQKNSLLLIKSIDCPVTSSAVCARAAGRMQLTRGVSVDAGGKWENCVWCGCPAPWCLLHASLHVSGLHDLPVH